MIRMTPAYEGRCGSEPLTVPYAQALAAKLGFDANLAMTLQAMLDATPPVTFASATTETDRDALRRLRELREQIRQHTGCAHSTARNYAERAVRALCGNAPKQRGGHRHNAGRPPSTVTVRDGTAYTCWLAQDASSKAIDTQATVVVSYQPGEGRSLTIRLQAPLGLLDGIPIMAVRCTPMEGGPPSASGAAMIVTLRQAQTMRATFLAEDERLIAEVSGSVAIFKHNVARLCQIIFSSCPNAMISDLTVTVPENRRTP